MLINEDDQAQGATFNIMKYEYEVTRWRNEFVNSEKMGTALLLLYEQCRNPKLVYDKEATKQSILKTSQDRITSIDQVLLGGVLTWPSSKLLLELARTNLQTDFPKLWKFKIPGSDKIMAVDEKFYPAPGNSQGGGSWTPTFLEVIPTYHHNTNKFFGLEHHDDGTWRVRCTRNLMNVDDSLPYTKWKALSHDGASQVYPEWNKE